MTVEACKHKSSYKYFGEFPNFVLEFQSFDINVGQKDEIAQMSISIPFCARSNLTISAQPASHACMSAVQIFLIRLQIEIMNKKKLK